MALAIYSYKQQRQIPLNFIKKEVITIDTLTLAVRLSFIPLWLFIIVALRLTWKDWQRILREMEDEQCEN